MFSAAIPFAVGMGLVAAGLTSTTVLFGGLYMLSSAVVFGLAALVLWATPTSSRRFGVGWTMLLVLVGAALASVNELVYFALPVTTLAIVLRERLCSSGRGGRCGQGPAPHRRLDVARLRAGLPRHAGHHLEQLSQRWVLRGLGHRPRSGCVDCATQPAAVVARGFFHVARIRPGWWPSARARAAPGRRPHHHRSPRLRDASGDLRELGSARSSSRCSRRRPSPACSSYSARTLAALSGQAQAFANSGDWGTGWRDSCGDSFAAACCSSRSSEGSSRITVSDVASSPE